MNAPIQFSDSQFHPMTLIDKNSPIPYYEQLAEILQREIRTHATGRGEVYPLPSENILARQHSITRATVRHALDKLERLGLIYREKGKGAFAVSQPVEPAPPPLLSTTEAARLRGWSLFTRILSVTQAPAPPRMAQALRLSPESSVFELKRLRFVETGPLSLQTAYIPIQLVPNLEEHDLTDSLYRLLETHYGLRLWTAQETLRARAATASEARLLQIRPRKPVMVCERVCFAVTGTPIEYLEAIWRSDRYAFNVTLSRSKT